MEQYFEVLSFSNDLIAFIGEKIDVPTEDFLCTIDDMCERDRFNSAIGNAIWHLINAGSSDIMLMRREVEKMLVEGKMEIFAKLAIQAAVEYFPNGYGHCEFFAYCAAVVGTAVRLYLREDQVKDEMIFEMAAGVIGTVLGGHLVVSKFDCSDETWREMTEVAEQFNAYHESLED